MVKWRNQAKKTVEVGLFQTECSKTSTVVHNGAPDRIRTCDTKNRNLVLYPTELQVHTIILSHEVFIVN